MSKIFVAGAAGNVGTAVLAALHDVDAEVVAGVHSEEKAAILSGLGIEPRVCDFADPGSMAAAMEGCDQMFLIVPMVEKMAKYGNIAVEAAKVSGIEYIVRSSGYAASSDAHWRLGREQGMVDQFVEDSGIPFTVLRPNSFMQNFATFLAGMVSSGVIALPEDNVPVSYIDVRDIAACAASLFKDHSGHENEYYAITGPEGLTYQQVAEKIGSAVGKEIVYTPIPEEVYVAEMEKMGIPSWNINMLVSLSRVIKLGMMGNATKAVEFLTGKPARSFDDFAVEYAEAWK